MSYLLFGKGLDKFSISVKIEANKVIFKTKKIKRKVSTPWKTIQETMQKTIST